MPLKISLRLRLLLILVALFTLVWVLVTTASYYAAQHEVEELFDAQLAQYARTLQALTQDRIGAADQARISLDKSFFGHSYEKKVAFQVWNDGVLVLHSDNAPPQPMSPLYGFTDQLLDGRLWRVFAMPAAEGAAGIQVAERYDVRDELVHKISLQVLYPLIIALPLLSVVLWFAVGGGLRPLNRITEEVGARSPRDLQPLAAAGIPSEIRPLVAALNRLLERLRRALENERRFTSDAAHELRTPLAILKTQAQVAQGAVSEAERRAALARIGEGVDRGTRLVGQLLALARIDPKTAGQEAESVDLAGLAARVVAEYAPAAVAKGVDLGLEDGATGRVCGYPEALEVVLRNLVDNAVKYTPEGGRVDVSVETGAEGVQLAVTDTGPGIVPELREQVFERFYRVAGSEVEGCGLGLSIVRQIADLHQAEVAINPGYDAGVRVTIRFPRML